MQAYRDPSREDEPTALPDIEVYLHDARDCPECGCATDHRDRGIGEDMGCTIDCAGWYWRACFPGCLPDSDPVGPFETEAEALADAREGMED